MLIIKNNNFSHNLVDYKLIAFDMDSTLINIECIDEMADIIGKKAEISTITKELMNSETLDFKLSLKKRLLLLKGINQIDLEKVLKERLKLNNKVPELIEFVKGFNLKILLISGGFTYFANYLKNLLKIDFVKANELEIINNQLTGKLKSQIWGDICDGEEKKKTLLELASLMNINVNQVIAVGDGSNDIPMLKMAGLSVAYNAKEKVKEHAKICIDNFDELIKLFKDNK